MKDIYEITGSVLLSFATIYTAFRHSFGNEPRQKNPLEARTDQHSGAATPATGPESMLKPKTLNSRLLSYFSFFDAFRKPNSEVPSEYYNDDFFKQSCKYPIGTLRDPLSKDYNEALRSAKNKIKRLRQDLVNEIMVSLEKKRISQSFTGPKKASQKKNKKQSLRKKTSINENTLSGSTTLYDVFELLEYEDIYSIFPIDGFSEGDGIAQCLQKISEEIFYPESTHNLFRYGTDMLSQINPHEPDSLRNLQTMKLFGIIIGRLAIEDNINADVDVESPFYAMLLDKPVTLDVINGADEKLKTNLERLIFKDLTDYGLTFSLDEENLNGKMVNYPISNEFSADEDVTNKNKIQFIKMLVDFKFVSRVRAKMEAFKEGFYSVISKEIHSTYKLTVDEVEIMLTGSTTVNVSKLKEVTVINEPRKYAECKTVTHFWEIMNEMSEKEKRLFLRFVTKRSDKLPSRMSIVIKSDMPRDKLPEARTCAESIRMPDYNNKALMKSKILQAIRYTWKTNERNKMESW